MVVDVKDVSIRYIVGDFRDIGLKDFVVRKLKGDFKVEEFWAVKNVSFSLDKGDFLAIIGTNGAGKSTLLKAISGIMRPQKGGCVTEGKISALLELGTGFDGDLSLRENIFLRGALLGYSKPFMVEKCEEILDFAELKEFENRKYKQLSSGMKSRLAFSIACFVIASEVFFSSPISAVMPQLRQSFLHTSEEVTTAIIGTSGRKCTIALATLPVALSTIIALAPT